MFLMCCRGRDSLEFLCSWVSLCILAFHSSNPSRGNAKPPKPGGNPATFVRPVILRPRHATGLPFRMSARSVAADDGLANMPGGRFAEKSEGDRQSGLGRTDILPITAVWNFPCPYSFDCVKGQGLGIRGVVP